MTMLIDYHKRSSLSRVGWLGTKPSQGLVFILCLVLLCAVIGLRNQLVIRMPAMAQIYAAAGIRVNLTGVEFRAIEARISRAEDGEQLLVEGEIENIAAGKKRIVALDIALKSETGGVIYRWKAVVPKKSLATGEKLKFIARLENPPPDFTSVQVNLAR